MAHAAMGHVLSRLNRYEEAVAALQRSLALKAPPEIANLTTPTPTPTKAPLCITWAGWMRHGAALNGPCP